LDRPDPADTERPSPPSLHEARDRARDLEPHTASVRVDEPGLRLEQRPDSNTDEWELVCIAPCDVSVPTAFRYRVSGGGVRTTAPFALRASDGEREVLRVEGGSQTLFALGVTGIFVGGAALVAGAYALLVVGVGAVTPAPGEGSGSMGSPPGLLPAGLLLTAGGALVAGGGWALMSANRAAEVSQDFETGQTPLASDGSRTETGRREWGTAAARARGITLSIVSVAF
jgi:hypothetical protein